MPEEKLKSGEVLTGLLSSRRFDRKKKEILTEPEVNLREATGLSGHGMIKFLAKELNLLRENIDQWLSGIRSIPQHHLAKTANLLKLNPDERFKLYESVLFPDGVPKLSSVFDKITDHPDRFFQFHNISDLRDLVNSTINCICLDENKNLATWESIHERARKENNPDLLLSWHTAEDKKLDHVALNTLKSHHIFLASAFAMIDQLPIKTEYKILIWAKAKAPESVKTLDEIFEPGNLVAEDGKLRKLGDILRELRESYCILKDEEKPLTWREAVGRAVKEDKFMLLAGIEKLTAEDIGKVVGVKSRQTVNYYEKGLSRNSPSRPDDEHLVKLAKFYGLNEDMLETLCAMPTESVKYKKTRAGNFVNAEKLGMFPPESSSRGR